MFDRFKKKTEPEEPKAAKVTEEPKPAVAEKPEAIEKPRIKARKTRKTAKEKSAEPAEDIGPKMHVDLKAAEKPFVGINEYSSASEIAEKIDKEISATKSALGEYLRQLDDKRAVAEKAQRIHDVVAKLAKRARAKQSKESKENPNQIKVNGLEIVLDATALNELTAIENVVQSHQQRLMALQKAREALKTFDEVGDTEGIKYLALEREGIPERILLKLS
jgi:hypothetical protein